MPETPEHSPGLPPGHPTAIGPYRLTAVLGEGGMGIVYAAEQEEPVRRRVAIKLIRGGRDESPEVVARFAAERQALAVMEHPAIAKVFDAGVTAEGEPYFVMEFISGTAITEWCDRHKVPTAERLRLFIEVCRAIQHAHQKGIIHRDLKPGNILMTEQAGVPHPMVIDFGIAKAVDLRLNEQAMVTQTGQIIGTPAYMAPEQADNEGMDIDTRADVYALGVILYELLVGRLPLDPKELGFLPFLARLVMRTTNTPTPSARLDTLAQEADTVAQQRRTDISHLRRQVAGDLDWITMRALEPERERRYGTAVALAEDLDRHLRHEPVIARPPTARYKIEKFVQRNRGAVLAGVLALVALVGGTITTAVGIVKANRAERAATSARLDAEREAKTASAVSGFLVDLFQTATPGPEMGGRLTARELLDRGVVRIQTELVDEPEVRAALLATLAQAYRQLGFYQNAVALQGDAVATAEAVLDPSAPRLADYLAGLAEMMPDTASDPRAVTQSTIVRDLRERVHAIRTLHLATDTMKWLNSVSGLAWLQQGAGHFDSAIARLDSAHRALARSVTPDSRYLLVVRDLKTRVYINEGRGEEAAEAIAALLADTLIGGAFWTEDRILSLRNNLVVALGNAGQQEQAIQLARANAARMGSTIDSANHASYEQLMWNLAGAYTGAGQVDEALATWRDLLSWTERIFGDSPHQVIGYLISIAGLEVEHRPLADFDATMNRIFPMIDAALRDPRIGARARGERNMAAHLLMERVHRTREYGLARRTLERRIPDDPWLVAGAIAGLADRLAEEDEMAAAALLRRQQFEALAKVPDLEAVGVVRDAARLLPIVRDPRRSGEAAVVRTGALTAVQRAALALGRNPGTTALDWNGLCWWGALAEQARAALPACDAAAEQADSLTLPRIRDSRGLARALTGDLTGAADDIAFYIAFRITQPDGETFVAGRREWVPALRNGQNPFTPEVLDAMRQ